MLDGGYQRGSGLQQGFFTYPESIKVDLKDRKTTLIPGFINPAQAHETSNSDVGQDFIAP